MKSSLLSLAILGTTSLAVNAADLYPGCSVPGVKAGHHTFYVDPARGSSSGDGSSAKPWRTLAEVLSPAAKLVATQGHGNGFARGYDTKFYDMNPKGPIKPGDVIMLMSGDHGSPDLNNMFNSEFITVMAGPGQTPVIRYLSLRSASKWAFQGLKFQDVFQKAQDPRKAVGLIRLGWGEFQGASSDIVLSNNTFSTADNTDGWTDADWQAKPYGYSIWSNVACTSIVGNTLSNIQNGIFLMASKSIVFGNTIKNFYTDAIDMVGSNQIIKGNKIQNNTATDKNPAHPDGIQGWTVYGLTNKNIVIDSNMVTNKTPSNGGWMQGISIFDGKWDGVKIVNNVVVTNAWHGIALYGVDNAVIENNTVMTTDPKSPIWIRTANAKDGRVARNPVVANNIAPQMIISGTGSTVQHNILSKYAAVPSAGSSSPGAAIGSGSTGDGNKIDGNIMNNFQSVNMTTGSYDLRLKSASSAIGYGSSANAPSLDIAGKQRSKPADVGAYKYN